MKVIDNKLPTNDQLIIEHFTRSISSAYALEEKQNGKIIGNGIFSRELRLLNNYIHENTLKESLLRKSLLNLYRNYLIAERIGQLQNIEQFKIHSSKVKNKYEKIVTAGEHLFNKMQMEIDALQD